MSGDEEYFEKLGRYVVWYEKDGIHWVKDNTTNQPAKLDDLTYEQATKLAEELNAIQAKKSKKS